MARASRTAVRRNSVGVGRVLLCFLEIPAGAAAMWIGWTLLLSNPLEEVFENSMVNFVPGALIPFMLYALIATAGGWLVYDAVVTLYRAARRALDRRRYAHLRR